MKKPSTQGPPRRTQSANSTPTSNAASTCHRRAVSAIPFSWEQHPGIAKHTAQTKAVAKTTIRTNTSTTLDNTSHKSLLPPPPPMPLSNIPIRPPKKSNSAAVIIADPFEIALAECAKAPPTPPGLMEEIWGTKIAVPQRMRWRFGLRVYSGCNVASACSIVDSKVHVPRAGVPNPSFRLLGHSRLM